ncbi:acetate/propionate family kinase [Melittangium boletus]|uniref:acetate/propionate family kinase n=1 Tax=Melittangium boletus TaxID=83453 RepID=UPI003DA692BB
MILVINSGSSSLKFGLYDGAATPARPVFKGAVRGIGGAQGSLDLQDARGQAIVQEEARFATQQDAFRRVAERLDTLGHPTPSALGHRVVHGGPHLLEHQALTDDVLHVLEAATHFAPLHIPPALTLIRDARARYPGVPQFACFDTAFHRTLPEEAAVYPLPRAYRERGVHRYGFHGLSYESIVRQLEPRVPERTVVAHLGSGASLAALHQGRSVDTSMGFTPTGGIPMGTRSGDLDPGVLLWLQRQAHLDTAALESLVNHDAGLHALSGGTSDLRELSLAAQAGDAQARLALDVFTRAIAKTVGAYAAVLGGIDLLVFTGGIGENSPEVRERVLARLAFLRMDVRVLPSDEEERIAHHTHRLATRLAPRC